MPDESHTERVASATARHLEGRARNKRLTLGSAVAILSIIGAVGSVGRWVLTPWFVAVASETLGAEIDNRIDNRTQPVKNGVKALLQSKIDELEGQRDLAYAARARDPAKWTDLDQMKLTQTEKQLETARKALAQFESPPLAAVK